MPHIKNTNTLIKNGRTEQLQKARAIALRTLETALEAVNPKNLLSSKVTIQDSRLVAGKLSFNLSKFKNIFVVGGGKASGLMAEELEAILGDRITEGAVNVPYGSKASTHFVTLQEAGHPVPDEAGVKGSKRIVEIAEKAGADSLVICLISGGGSSLMPLPIESVSIDDKKWVTQALLKSGASIVEVNIVRKHLSSIKGGWLAEKTYPAAVLNLVLSDVVGDSLDTIASGPTVPDPSTFFQAVQVLQKYGLWEVVPPSVKKTLAAGQKGAIMETLKPGSRVFNHVHNLIIGNCRSACLAAKECFENQGLNTAFLTATLEGEAKEVAGVMASAAREVAASSNPISKPAGIVAGGETTVKVTGSGLGGRNQEMALAAALRIGGLDNCVMACFSTDGVDGPTEAAGAIVDGQTLVRAAELELSAEHFLTENDSYTFFKKLGDLIVTGQTETNVNDLSLIILL